MKIEVNQLIREYHEQVREKYPDLSFEQVQACCTTPFVFTAQQMASGQLPTMRLKNFGMFTALKKRSEKMLEKMQEKVEKGTLTQGTFNKKKQIIENHLNKQP